MRLFRPGAFFAIILCGTVCTGCLFEPRTPEMPGESINYFDRADPDKVMANLELAMGGGDAGGYLEMLSEDFRYEPDSETVAKYPGVDWENWGHEQETSFINSFLGNVQGVSADLQAEVIQGWEGSGTEATLRYVYTAVVTEIDGGQVPYRASVEFHFRLDATFWVLDFWRDEQGQTDPDSGAPLPSLGDRRGAFAASGGG